jgi:hypothetical protein
MSGWTIKAETAPDTVQLFVVDLAGEADALQLVRRTTCAGARLTTVASIRDSVIEGLRPWGLAPGAALSID